MTDATDSDNIEDNTAQAMRLAAPELLDLVHESIILTDADGAILFWNAASEEMYGWPRKSVLGRTVDALFGTQQYPADRQDAWQGEIWRDGADGEKRLIEVRCRSDRAPDGRMRFIETGRDVTSVREAEALLQKSEHRYRNLFQAMAASFWELDFFPVGEMLYRLRKTGAVNDYESYFAANPQFVREMMRATRVIDINEQTVRLFGRGERKELLGSVEPFWPQDSTGVFAASVIAAITGKPNYSAETRLRRIDGKEFDALFTACFPPDTMNKGTLLIGVIDMSEQVAARAAVAEMQNNLAHAARISMLGEFAASIAHEVNQPLAAIHANAAAGLRWLSRNEPNLPEAQVSMERVVEDANRASEIIGRIRTMAAGGTIKPTVLSLNAVIEETALFLRDELRKNEIQLFLDLSEYAPKIVADRVQVQQVFVNLSMNAIQALVGSDTTEPKLELLTRVAGDDSVLVTVRDNGPGFRPDDLPRLFDSFFTTRKEGMGLGLAITRSIVDGLGGTISTENRAEGGAEFRIHLPVFANG